MPRVLKAAQVRMRSAETADAPPAVPPDPNTPRGGDTEPETESAQALLAEAERARDDMLARARAQADELLGTAGEEARVVRGQAAAEAGNLRERARQEGLAQGLDEARREVEALFVRAQAEIDEALDEAHKQRDAMMDSLEPRIFKLALEAAGKILGYELDNSDGAFLSMLRQALANVKSESHVTLRVNPSEYVRYFKSREVTMHTRNGAMKAEVVNDPTVDYGGCLIETESGAIDAGVDAQLKQIGLNLGLKED